MSTVLISDDGDDITVAYTTDSDEESLVLLAEAASVILNPEKEVVVDE